MNPREPTLGGGYRYLLRGAPAVAIGEYICTPHVFLRRMRGVSMLSKAPGGRLGILGMYSEGRPARGSVVHAWLHTVKHTQTLNFDLNFRVLGGFCGSIGVKQGGAPRW